MLEITVPGTSFFDERTREFRETKPQTLRLEHSLLAISKWEAKWNKPFLSREPKTTEETIDYVRCMTLSQNVDPLCYYAITSDLYKQISDYIEQPMTAAKFRKDNRRPSRETVTAETVYYWMISLNMPVELFQKRHLNSLLAQIREIEIHQEQPKKMGKRELAERNRALNAARCAKYHTRG